MNFQYDNLAVKISHSSFYYHICYLIKKPLFARVLGFFYIKQCDIQKTKRENPIKIQGDYFALNKILKNSLKVKLRSFAW